MLHVLLLIAGCCLLLILMLRARPSAPDTAVMVDANILRFDLATGDLVGIGSQFADRLGYASAEDGLWHFNQQSHFKNASLSQLVSGLVPVTRLTLQDRDGARLDPSLRLSLKRLGDQLELETRDSQRCQMISQGPQLTSDDRGSVGLGASMDDLLPLLERSQPPAQGGVYAAAVSMPDAKLHLSRRFADRLGLPSQEAVLTRLAWRDWFHPADLAHFEAAFDQPTSVKLRKVRMASAEGRALVFSVHGLSLPPQLKPAALAPIKDKRDSGDRKIFLFRPAIEQQPPAPAGKFEPSRHAESLLKGDRADVGLSRPSSEKASVLEIDAPDAVPESTASFVKAGQGIGKGKAKVLLVEDDPIVQQMLIRSLQGFEIELSVASSVDEALGLWKRHSDFDLILTDYYLQDGSAEPLLDQINSHVLSPAVVLLSAASIDHPAIVAVLQKPFAVQDFKRTVSTHLAAAVHLASPLPGSANRKGHA